MKNKQSILFTVISIITLLAVLGSLLYISISDQDESMKLSNSIETLQFLQNPFSMKEIEANAHSHNIKKEDISFSCPEPKKSGINECLMVNFQQNYGKGTYQGDKSELFNSLLLNYSQGELTEQDVRAKIENEPSWDEVIPNISRNNNPIQVSIANVEMGQFETESHLANQIWSQITSNNLPFNSDYYEVLITYHEETNKNIVSVLGVNMVYVESF